VAFSTQKLTRQSIKSRSMWASGEVDSSSSSPPSTREITLRGSRNLSLDPDVYATADRQVALTGLPLVLKYFGTGDVGVPPLEPSVAWLEQSLAGPGPAHVRSVAPDQMAHDLMAGDGGRSPERLQRYRGEFLLTSHGTGCYTSQAAMKRFNRKNERLADDAEKAIVAGWWLGGASYPRERLREAWTRMLWHQFHDDLTGTSIPEAYTFSWNDETIAGTTFADVLGEGVGAVTRALDTRGNGASLVVFNPLAWEREDVVEAEVRFPGGGPPAIRVVDPDGREVPAQLNSVAGETAHVAFVARVVPVSFSVFKVLPAASAADGGLKVDSKGLESSRYRVTLDADGDIGSVLDKSLGRELLSAPLRLQLVDDDAQVVRLGGRVRRPLVTAARGGSRPCRGSDRGEGPGARRPRGLAPGRRLHLHAADFYCRRRRRLSRRGPDRHRLADQGDAPRPGSHRPANPRHLRSRPRGRTATNQPTQPLRGPRAAVGRPHRHHRGLRHHGCHGQPPRLGQA
jgi:hypothetical protein